MTGTAISTTLRLTALTSLLALAACDEAGQFKLPTFGGAPDVRDATGGAGLPQGVQLIEQDVEAPEVFQVTDRGLWDGRPSLGGVWVAHPAVTQPERVIIRNQSNDTFVIGALFKKEAAIAGPKFQVSSDAAQALNMLAGAPVTLNVTALRKQETPTAQAASAPDGAKASAKSSANAATKPTANASVTAAPLAAPAAAANAAKPSTPQPAPKPKPASTLSKPYVQLGIFSKEANAKRTADMMRSAGAVPTVRQQTSSGKTFYRVLIGPAQTAEARSDLLAKARGAGFTDAYTTSN